MQLCIISTSRYLNDNLISQLCKTVDARDRIIEHLESELENSRIYNEKENVQHSELLVSDLESYRNEIEEYRDTISKLQYKLSHYNAENQRINGYNKQLEEQIRTQNIQFDVQKKRLINLEKVSNDAKRAQKDEIGEQYRLELENQA